MARAPASAEPAEARAKSRVWGLLDQRSPVFGYVDGPRFIASPTFRAILEAVREVQAQRPGAPDPLTELTSNVRLRSVESGARARFHRRSEDGGGDVRVAALDGKAERAFSCFESVGKPEPREPRGSDRALQRRTVSSRAGRLAAVRPAREARRSCSPPFPSRGGTPPAEDYLFVTGEFPNLRRGTRFFTMAPASAGTRLRLVAQAGSPERAAELEAQARQLLAVVPERLAAEPPELQRIAKTFSRT